MKVKCIEKIRDKNNHIIGYKIINKDKNVKQVKPDELKKAIRSGKIEVINLTLTSDNRLIAKKPDTPSEPDVNIESMLNRVRTLGYVINTFGTYCGHKCYIASSTDNTKYLLIIPDDVKYIYETNADVIAAQNKKIWDYMSNIKGALKVVGGKNLISACCMFINCGAQSIDLSSLDTSNVTDMRDMFHSCEAQSINLSSFDTSNVTDMRHMFFGCEVLSINLRSFNTSKVTNMSHMFCDCRAQSIDLTSFNTSNVTNMSGMFNKCKAQSLDLRSFDTSKVTNMERMFWECKAQSIDLSSFNTSKVKNMSEMFDSCKAQPLDLRSFNTSKVKNMSGMFYECEAQYIDLSSFNTSKVTDMDYMFVGCKSQIKVNDPKLKDQLQSDKGIKPHIWK